MKEQLLYEVHDPAAYLTPDVVADISEADVASSAGIDRVEVTGVRGHARPATLKVNVFYEGGWLGRRRDLVRRAARRGARAARRATCCARRLLGLGLRRCAST